MKQLIFIITFLAACQFCFSQQEIPSVARQVFSNFHFGFNGNKAAKYKWNNFYIGTAYETPIGDSGKNWWSLGLDINWSNYTLYRDGFDFMGEKDVKFKTTSFGVPLYLHHQPFTNFWSGLDFYAGPVYEYFFYNNISGNVPDIHNSQIALTAGARLRFGAIFSIRAAYSFYPFPFLMGGYVNRSSANISIGF